jgi:ABC-type nitrate/sulfonate/bicarbonate transport system substrate-binding protein
MTAIACAALALVGVQARPTDAQTPPTVRLSVCGTCTSEGVEGLILKQTNIAQLVGLNLDVLFLNPPDMGQGIASKSLDVEWVGDQPTLSQLANGIPVTIVGYQFDFQLRLEAPPSIKSVSDLKGKKVGTPFGTTAYELAASTVQDAHLPPSTLINIAPTDLGTALAGGQVAAVSIWDPLWGIIESKQHTHPLATAFHTGFVLARTQFLQDNRDAVVKYLEAQILAIAFRANHHEEADQRYQAAFNIPQAVARAAEEFDRDYNWKDPAKVDLALQPKDYKDLSDTEKFALAAKLLPRQVDVNSAIDMSLCKDALARIKASKIAVSQIRYVNNEK